MSLPNNEKLLEKVDSGYTCNLWTPILKSLKMNVAHVHNIVLYTGLTCLIYGSEKTYKKWSRVKIHISKRVASK